MRISDWSSDVCSSDLPVNDRSEIARATMRQGNGAVFLEQKLRHRLAHDIGAAHDNGFQPVKADHFILQQHLAAQRCAGHHSLLTQDHHASVDDVEYITLLVAI